MSLFNWFAKPKWQSPNEQVRLTAVQTGQEHDLIQQLSNIAANDASLKVRKAALSRINDPALLSHMATHNDHNEIQKLALKKWTQSLMDSDDVSAIERIKDNDSLIELAKSAHHANMRLKAIEAINQQGTLGDLLLKETDDAVQQAILAKLEQASTLLRIAKPLKKKNKKLFQQIQNKLNGGNQAPDHDQQALHICQKLEAVVHSQQTVNLQDIEKQWQAIEHYVSATHKQRYNGAYAAAKMVLDPEHRDSFLSKQKEQRAQSQLVELQQLAAKAAQSNLQQLQNQVQKYQSQDISALPDHAQNDYQAALSQLIAARDEQFQIQKVPESATQAYDALQKVLSQEVVQPHALNQFKKRWSQAVQGAHPSVSLKQLTAQFDQGILKLAEKIEHSAKKRDEAANQLLELIDQATLEIKEGHLSQAKVITNEMANLKRTAGQQHPLVRKNKYRIDGVWTQLKELRQWQKWSNDKVRQDIIDELKSLIGTATHPDAVLKKLKESNERWYALEDMEKLEGDKFPSRNQKMWQQFRDVSKALFEPTQPFFEKRSEQQNSRLEDIQNLIKEMKTLDLDDSEERDMARITRNAIKHLKSLDQLPPNQRGKVAKQLRAGIDRIDAKLKTFYDAAEAKKRQLIEQVQALHDHEDLNDAIEQAKALQGKWKQAGIVKQYTERKLWKQFRKANDALFKKRDAAHQEKNAAYDAQRKTAQGWLNEHSASLKKAKNEVEIKQLTSQLTENWQAMEHPIKNLDGAYQAALQKAEQAIADLQAKARLDQLNIWQQLDQQALSEDTAAVEQALSAMSEEDRAIGQIRTSNEANDDHCDALLLQAEFLSGLETPKKHIEARMAYQVQVLSDRMAGEKLVAENEQALQLLQQWYQAPKSAEYHKCNKKRIDTCLKALQKLV